MLPLGASMWWMVLFFVVLVSLPILVAAFVMWQGNQESEIGK